MLATNAFHCLLPKFLLIVLTYGTVQAIQGTQTAGFKCPDELASQACASFSRAKHTLEKGEVVCFRQSRDQYFDLSYGSYQIAAWDKTGSNGLPRAGAKANRLFSAMTMDNGVENDRLMPYARVQGTWHYNGVYSFSRYDKTDLTSFSSDASSLRFVNKYLGSFDRSITYVLSIDLRSNRFSEEWNSHSGNNDERDIGKCIVGQ